MNGFFLEVTPKSILQQLVREFVVHLHIKVAIAQYFNVVRDIIDAHKAGKGYIKIQSLLRGRALLFRSDGIESGHIVQAIGKLND